MWNKELFAKSKTFTNDSIGDDLNEHIDPFINSHKPQPVYSRRRRLDELIERMENRGVRAPPLDSVSQSPHQIDRLIGDPCPFGAKKFQFLSRIGLNKSQSFNFKFFFDSV